MDDVPRLEFNLENLCRALEGGGYSVLSSGPDAHAYLADARNLPVIGRLVPPPTFFAVVKVDGDRLRGTAALMEFIWAAFGRGRMEFNGTEYEGEFVVRIIELQNCD